MVAANEHCRGIIVRIRGCISRDLGISKRGRVAALPSVSVRVSRGSPFVPTTSLGTTDCRRRGAVCATLVWPNTPNVCVFTFLVINKLWSSREQCNARTSPNAPPGYVAICRSTLSAPPRRFSRCGQRRKPLSTALVSLISIREATLLLYPSRARGICSGRSLRSCQIRGASKSARGTAISMAV